VDWQIYSHRTKAVELKATTEGSSRMPEARQEAGAQALSQAFVAAARNLLADARFHDLLSGAGPDAPGRRPELEPIPVAYETLPARPTQSVESVVSDSRMGVVTVFAGDAMGSGFLISSDGYLLTNQHVIGKARYVRVRFVTGREVNGEVVRADRRRDVALVKLESDIYQTLPLGESSLVRPGAEVFAIGTPLAENLGQTVTRGVLSGYGEEDGLRILRSDVSVHKGNSGGPLLAPSGVVVGLSVSGFLLMPTGVGVGLNSFIPIEEALDALVIHRSKQR
jgi:S1-C subfamily serine protease